MPEVFRGLGLGLGFDMGNDWCVRGAVWGSGDPSQDARCLGWDDDFWVDSLEECPNFDAHSGQTSIDAPSITTFLP